MLIAITSGEGPGGSRPHSLLPPSCTYEHPTPPRPPRTVHQSSFLVLLPRLRSRPGPSASAENFARVVHQGDLPGVNEPWRRGLQVLCHRPGVLLLLRRTVGPSSLPPSTPPSGTSDTMISTSSLSRRGRNGAATTPAPPSSPGKQLSDET